MRKLLVGFIIGAAVTGGIASAQIDEPILNVDPVCRYATTLYNGDGTGPLYIIGNQCTDSALDGVWVEVRIPKAPDLIADLDDWYDNHL